MGAGEDRRQRPFSLPRGCPGLHNAPQMPHPGPVAFQHDVPQHKGLCGWQNMVGSEVGRCPGSAYGPCEREAAGQGRDKM